MRHGKAEPYADSDRDRALTSRGRRDAAEAGRVLAAQGVVPDHALVSPSLRTRETWDEVVAALESPPEVTFLEDLYGAEPHEILEAVRMVPAEAEVVMVVGHNPGVQYLVATLGDGTGDPAQLREVMAGFPTSAYAVFGVPGPWGDLQDGAARLVDCHMPAG